MRVARGAGRAIAVAALLAALGAGGGGCARERAGNVPAGEPRVLPERYAHSIAALGFPGARRAFQVGGGSVVGTGEAALEFVPRDGAAARVSPIAFERDGVPIAHWWMVSADESTHFEAAAAPDPLVGDTGLVLAIRATTTRLGAAAGEVGFTARIRSLAAGSSFIPWDAPAETTYSEAWRAPFALRNGRVVAAVDRGAALPPDAPSTARPARFSGEGPGTLSARCAVELAPGQRRVWGFWMPAYPIAPALAKRLAGEASFERVAATARSEWRRWLDRAAPLATPDTLLNAAYRAALVTLVMSHERSGDDWMPLGNPFQYRDVWLRDGAQAVRALAVAGLTDLARADAWTMRRFQFAEGAFLSQQGQLDGTGQAMWALAVAASCPPDSGVARRALPLAERGLRWLEHERTLSRRLESPWGGLLPYADPRDNELVRAQLVGNDLWGLIGESSATALARLAGDAAFEREASTAAADYRATILEALARGRFADVPASWQGPGRDWGNLEAGFPARLLPADHPRLAALARRVWAGAGGPGLVTFASSDSLHSYVGMDLAEWALLADRPADARATLADLLVHASSTLGFAEHFSRRDGGFGTNLPPHATAAAKLVQLTRDMVVGDVRDTLELARGGSPEWWRGTRFERAPTRFGVIDVALERPAPGRLRARWSAVPVLTRVRIPDGWLATAATPATARVVDGRWIECPPGTTEIEAVVVERPSGGAR